MPGRPSGPRAAEGGKGDMRLPNSKSHLPDEHAPSAGAGSQLSPNTMTASTRNAQLTSAPGLAHFAQDTSGRDCTTPTPDRETYQASSGEEWLPHDTELQRARQSYRQESSTDGGLEPAKNNIPLQGSSKQQEHQQAATTTGRHVSPATSICRARCRDRLQRTRSTRRT